jgi:predicted dehydrogenase
MRKYKQPSDIKVGVVGYGPSFNMGRAHMNEMKKAGMTPVAVADLDPARRAVAQADFPEIETYDSLTQMLKKSKVDLVTVITPHTTHTPLALQALKAGRHVVSEKPLAITTAQCDAMIAAARKSGVILSTYHNRHWDGSIMEALRQIRAGVIGDVIRIEAHMGVWDKPGDWWRSSKSISGGILYDWGVHLLEYSLQIIQSDIKEVTGFARKGYWGPKILWKNDTIEDEGFAIVRFATSIDSNPKRGMLEITGTKGTYILSYNEWETVGHQGGQTIITKGKSPPSEGWRFYQNIVDHLVKGVPLVITGQWARRPIHILDLAGRSAERGQSLKPKYK